MGARADAAAAAAGPSGPPSIFSTAPYSSERCDFLTDLVESGLPPSRAILASLADLRAARAGAPPAQQQQQQPKRKTLGEGAVSLVPESDRIYQHPCAWWINCVDAFLFGLFAYMLGFRHLGCNLVLAVEHGSWTCCIPPRSFRRRYCSCGTWWCAAAVAALSSSTPLLKKKGGEAKTVHAAPPSPNSSPTTPFAKKQPDEVSPATFYHLEERSTSFNGRLVRNAGVKRRLQFVGFFVIISLICTWFACVFPDILPDSTRTLFTSLLIAVTQGLESVMTDGRLNANSTLLLYMNCIVGTGFIIHLLGRQKHSNLIELPRGGLTAVFPAFLRSNYPLAMVSYSWGDANGSKPATTARSLAAVLPDAWLDVKWLSPGQHVPSETAAATDTTYALVLLVTAGYFSRPACALEFATAVLKREQRNQITIVFCPSRDLPDRTRDLIIAAGFKYFESADALLEFLGSHVYACATIDDKERIVRWYQRYGKPLATN